MAGAKVLMLEAGRNYDPVKETPMFQTNGQAPLRGRRRLDRRGGAGCDQRGIGKD